jgi:hypothetical protein
MCRHVRHCGGCKPQTQNPKPKTQNPTPNPNPNPNTSITAYRRARVSCVRGLCVHACVTRCVESGRTPVRDGERHHPPHTDHQHKPQSVAAERHEATCAACAAGAYPRRAARRAAKTLRRRRSCCHRGSRARPAVGTGAAAVVVPDARMLLWRHSPSMNEAVQAHCA